MKNKTKGKLLLSIATLSLALVSSVGSTFAWFLMSEKADLSGLDIQVTTGSSVLLKDRDNSTDTQEIYTDTFKIKNSDAAKWELIRPTKLTATSVEDGAESGTATSMTINSSSWKDTFNTLDITNTVKDKKWTYNDISSSTENITDTDVYGTSSTVDGTKDNIAYFYKIDFKYRVSAGYDVNITVNQSTIKVTDKKDNELTRGQSDQTADKVIRVAFQDNNAKTASVYRIAKTTTKDYNEAQINELIDKTGGTTLTGDQYNCTLLSDNNKHKVTAPKTPTYTDDKAFYYGTTSMYVWYDGSDKACSNAVFEQTCTFGVTFTAVEQNKTGA